MSVRVNCVVNGQAREVDGVWEAESLLVMLRDRLGLTGTKNACEQGECGSCTVLLDDVAVCACLVAAGQAEGRAVTTVEGLGRRGGEAAGGVGGRAAPAPGTGTLTALQRAFLRAGAVQCGFCTPGLLVTADDLLRRAPDPAALSDADLREALAGNLCRCTGYAQILDAVRSVASGREGTDAP